MNTYRKMYVICEDEYRRLLENNEGTVVNMPKLAEAEQKVLDTIDSIQPQHKRRYQCMQCDKDYSDKHDLRRHINNNHKVESEVVELHVNKDKVEPSEVQVNKVESVDNIKAKRKHKRLPPRDPFIHIIKKWRTL